MLRKNYGTKVCEGDRKKKEICNNYIYLFVHIGLVVV